MATIFLHSQDIFLTPIYLLIVSFIINHYSKSKTKGRLERKYFLIGAYSRIFGGLSLGIIYEFVYQGGDTSAYWLYGTRITDLFLQDPLIGLQMLIEFGDKYSPEVLRYIYDIIWHPNPTEFSICILSGLIGIFSFKTYSVITIFFALISFSGSWKMYQTFTFLYPEQKKKLLISCLLIPSVIFWGGGMMKDTICLGALGWLFWAFHMGLIEKKQIIKSVIIATVSIYTIATIKIYILLAFLPPAMNWIFLEQIKKVKNKSLRLILAPFFISLGLIVATLGMTNLTEGDERFDIDNIGERTKINQEWLSGGVQTGSAYNIGKLDGTLNSIIEVAPQAVVVTLFRPYLWEVRSPIMLLSAFEATFFLLYTVYLFITIGVLKTLKLIFSKPILLFSFVFCIILAIGVGTSSGNFGTLVRYKIPLLPFYLSALIIMKSHIKDKQKIRKG